MPEETFLVVGIFIASTSQTAKPFQDKSCDIKKQMKKWWADDEQKTHAPIAQQVIVLLLSVLR